MKTWLNKINIVALIALSVIAMIIISLIFSVVSCMIPKSLIRENVLSSAQTLENEGAYPTFLIDSNRFKLDSYSDAVTLNVAATYNTATPFASAIANDYIITVDTSDTYDAIVEGVAYTVDSNTNSNETLSISYARNWILNSALLRYVLVFTDLAGFRNFLFFAMLLLFVLCIKKIYDRLGAAISIAFVATSAFFYSVPISVCLSFNHEYTILYAAIIALLTFRDEHYHRYSIFLFFISGFSVFLWGFTSATVVTVGMPAVVHALLSAKKGNSFLKTAISTLIYSISWTAGLVVSLVSKQLIAIVYQNDFSGFSRMLSWSGVAEETFTIRDRVVSIITAFIRLWDIEMPQQVSLVRVGLVLVAVGVVVVALLFIMIKDKKSFANNYLVLPIIALYPVVWIFVFSIHAGHFFVSYKYMVTFFALACMLAKLAEYIIVNIATAIKSRAKT